MIRYLAIILIFLSCKFDNSAMRLKDIPPQTDINIFEVVKSKSDNPLDWKIKPTKEILIPYTDAHFIVKAKMIDSDKNVSDCFINLILPERIADFVIYSDTNGLKYSAIYELKGIDVIPAVASEAYGDYELYYSKNYPDIGIDILRNGLRLSKDPSLIAENLGYILRDEKRYQESIDAFLIAEKHGVSSEYTYIELSDLYLSLGDYDKSKEYDEKAKELTKRWRSEMGFPEIENDCPDIEPAFPPDLPKPNKYDLHYITEKYNCKFSYPFISFQLVHYHCTSMDKNDFKGFGWANRELEPNMNLEKVVNDFRELGYPDYLTPFKQVNGDFWCFDNREVLNMVEYRVVIWNHKLNEIEKSKNLQWDCFYDWLERTKKDDI